MNPYFITCPDYDPARLRAALLQLLAPLGSMDSFVKPGQKVLLKPNLLSADEPGKRITTDPALVREVGRLALEAGGQVMIGDSPALDNFNKTATRTGMRTVALELGLELVELNQPVRVETPAGGRYQSLELSRPALEADVIINLPKLKTHSQMVLTLGVKNMFGTVVGMRKGEWHHMAGRDLIAFASMLLDVARTVKPALTIMDGIWGMEGQGPSNGDARHFGLLAAGRQPLTLDLNLAAMLGLDWDMFPLAQAAAALGQLPDPWPEPVWLDGEALVLKNVKLPVAASIRFLPGFMEGLTRRYLVSRPAQDLARCILCGKCQDICPEKCISRKNKTLLFDYGRCIRCYCCQEVCPANAVLLKPGWLARALNLLGR